MRLTIIPDDSAVGVDEEFFFPIDLSQMDLSIHAVQWYGEYGEIEYKTRLEEGVLVKPANTVITDVAPYQFAVNAWTVAKDAYMREMPTAGTSKIPVTEA